MTYVVTEPCINCKHTSCVEVCPVEAFREGLNFLVIDPDDCIDCAVCVPECPVNAIYAEEDVPADQQEFTALNAELSDLYPEPGANHFTLDPEQVTGGRGAFLVIRRDGEAVGCGAVRVLDDETAELKRMYTAPMARGTGLGRKLVAALEAEAQALGVRRLVLETGTRQHAALAVGIGVAGVFRPERDAVDAVLADDAPPQRVVGIEHLQILRQRMRRRFRFPQRQ